MLRPALLTLIFSAISAPATADTLSVTFTGITKPEGRIMVGLYDSPTAYNSDQALSSAAIEVSSDTASATFDVPAGTYAIKSFHDVNGNGKMDTNPFGMPIEPFAFSNNARGNMGPANWVDAAFEVQESITHTIGF